MAKSIHISSRLPGKFIPVDCPAIQPSLAESELFGHVKGSFTNAFNTRKGSIAQAEKGTLFLDEIHHLSLETQSKLLRYLQEGKYKPVGSDTIKENNARIIVASNKNLKDLVAQGLYREDLFRRLNYGYVYIPPLRNQPEAILPMFEEFMLMAPKNAILSDHAESSKELLLNSFVECENGVEETLQGYGWPGNYRELQSCADKTFIESRWNNGIITNKMTLLSR